MLHHKILLVSSSLEQPAFKEGTPNKKSSRGLRAASFVSCSYLLVFIPFFPFNKLETLGVTFFSHVNRSLRLKASHELEQQVESEI